MTWKTPPTRFTGQVKKDTGTFVKRIALVILRILVVESPVDEGRFVNNWLVGISNRLTGTLAGTDKNRTIAFARGKRVLAKYAAFRPVFISNNLPYARKLNEGSSDQAPANFVEKSVRKAAK